MADDKEVKKPSEISKETTKPGELSDADLEETAGGCGIGTLGVGHT
jgi:hypothetical protein